MSAEVKPLYFNLLMEFSMKGEEYDLDFDTDFDKICKLIGRELKSAPKDKKPKKSLWDYVNKIYPLIVLQQSRGLSDEAICQIIERVSKKSISPKTLQNYLSRIKSARQKKGCKNLSKRKNQQRLDDQAQDNPPKVAVKSASANKPRIEAAINEEGEFNLAAFLEQIPDDTPVKSKVVGVETGQRIDGEWFEPEFNIIREKV